MKLLLTSAGIKNPSLEKTLVDMLGKPIAECSALCITTASYPLSNGTFLAYSFISGYESETPMSELGWKSVGVLELTALPSLDQSIWLTTVQAADVILVNGGDTVFLGHWMRQSGLADLLPSLKAVYVGLSAGSLVMCSRIGEEFMHWTKPKNGDEALGFVNFEIFPHLDHEMLPEHAMPYAEKWAAKLTVPGYAIDDETAIKVVDGTIEVISEGNWKLFRPQ